MCLDHIQAEGYDLGRILVPSSVLCFWSWGRGCGKGRAGPGAWQEGAVHMRPRGHCGSLPFRCCSKRSCCIASVWLAAGGSWHFPVPVWELRQLSFISFFSFFLNLCIYFWLLTKGSMVPSRHSVSWNLSTQHTSSTAQAWASHTATKVLVKMQLSSSAFPQRASRNGPWRVFQNSFFWVKFSPFCCLFNRNAHFHWAESKPLDNSNGELFLHWG